MKNNLKKLAMLTIDGNKINPKVAKYVLQNLSRKDLIKYLFYLKNLISKNSVLVESSTPLNKKMQVELTRKFVGKNVSFKINDSIEEGLRIVVDDTIIDLTLGNYINQTINNIKSSYE